MNCFIEQGPGADISWKTSAAAKKSRRGVRPTRTKTPLQFQSAAFAALVQKQLEIIGEDPARDGLERTPHRVAKAFEELTRGYRQDPREVVNGALFDVKSDEMVIVRDIDFYSLCEHHLLPFFGKCHIGYLPEDRVIGLSKLPRLVDVFARRLQVQERLTVQIAETVLELTGARGVGVVIEGQHLCMQMRGVEKQSSVALTSSMLGAFRDDSRTRSEFLSLVRGGRFGA
jgi:GTP cyclohydrolase I